MSDSQRALDASLELAQRFAVAVDQGLLVQLRRQRRQRAPWEPEDQATIDLRRIGALVRSLHAAADELVDIAARHQEPDAECHHRHAER